MHPRFSATSHNESSYRYVSGTNSFEEIQEEVELHSDEGIDHSQHQENEVMGRNCSSGSDSEPKSHSENSAPNQDSPLDESTSKKLNFTSNEFSGRAVSSLDVRSLGRKKIEEEKSPLQHHLE